MSLCGNPRAANRGRDPIFDLEAFEAALQAPFWRKSALAETYVFGEVFDSHDFLKGSGATRVRPVNLERCVLGFYE